MFMFHFIALTSKKPKAFYLSNFILNQSPRPPLTPNPPRRRLSEKRTMNGVSDEKPTDLSQSWKIVLVPDKHPVSPHLQETVSMFAASIKPKCANLVVRKLNQIAPLESLRHVKRIRKTSVDGGRGKTQLSVILCIASPDRESNNMPKDVFELVNTYQLSTFIVKVCKYAASTKEEWEEQCKLWPTSFHPPTYNIYGVTGFSEEDSLTVFNIMKIAVSLAKSGIGVGCQCCCYSGSFNLPGYCFGM